MWGQPESEVRFEDPGWFSPVGAPGRTSFMVYILSDNENRVLRRKSRPSPPAVPGEEGMIHLFRYFAGHVWNKEVMLLGYLTFLALCSRSKYFLVPCGLRRASNEGISEFFSLKQQERAAIAARVVDSGKYWEGLSAISGPLQEVEDRLPVPGGDLGGLRPRSMADVFTIHEAGSPTTVVGGQLTDIVRGGDEVAVAVNDQARDPCHGGVEVR